MKRDEIYDARLDPIEGSEQGGSRPVIIISRNSINAASSIIIVVPCTTYKQNRRIYPSQVLLRAPEGGLSNDSVALCEQLRVLDQKRLLRQRGFLSEETIKQLEQAILITLDLPGQ